MATGRKMLATVIIVLCAVITLEGDSIEKVKFHDIIVQAEQNGLLNSSEIAKLNMTDYELDQYILHEMYNGMTTRDTGYFGDGAWWHCPHDGFWSGCHDGDVRCDGVCPGGGLKKFKLSCKKKGTFKGCGKPERGHNCQRFKKCNACQNHLLHETSKQSCRTCKAGYLLGPGDCTRDLDECVTSKHACEQCCVNTYGSYKCTCQDGYKLRNDGRSCDKLNCEHPGDFHEKGLAVATNNWNQNSYAKFSCKIPFILEGPFHKKCIGLVKSGVDVHGWEEQRLPTCIDRCDDAVVATQPLCGWADIDGDSCANMGCCFHVVSLTCRQKPGNIYSRYKGEKATIKPIANYQRTLPQTCAYYCDKNSKCKSFMVQHQKISNDLVNHICYLLDKPRPQQVDEGSIVPHSDYDINQIVIQNNDGESPDEILSKKKKVPTATLR